MRIYVDFDDVLCETARALSALAANRFGHRVPYRSIHAFDLQTSFGINFEEYCELMDRAHAPEFMERLPPTPGAVQTVAAWREQGHQVHVVTGRPFATRLCSDAWLARHGLEGLPVIHVDKYGREPRPLAPDTPRSLSFAEFRNLQFDAAVEDSPVALDQLALLNPAIIAIYNRPWNARYEPRHPSMKRCRSWREVGCLVRRNAAATQ